MEEAKGLRKVQESSSEDVPRLKGETWAGVSKL